jgi:hypothetical protein
MNPLPTRRITRKGLVKMQTFSSTWMFHAGQVRRRWKTKEEGPAATVKG